MLSPTATSAKIAHENMTPPKSVPGVVISGGRMIGRK
jgi:hypothetical protein